MKERNQYEIQEEEKTGAGAVSYTHLKMEAAGEFYASYIDPLSLSNTGDITSIPPAYGTGII